MTKKLDEFLVREGTTIKEAMRQMGKVGEKVLFVVDEKNKLLGSLTDGDIRRWVLREGSITADLNGVYNKEPITVPRNYVIGDIKQMMVNRNIEGIPVVNEDGSLADILLWNKVFGGENGNLPKRKIDLPIVIMAGGKGTRLDPFTRILPKPLIPIGDKAIIELILDKFQLYDVDRFFITTNHRSRMIKAYLEELDKDYKVEFIEEEKPLGTAGSLRFLKSKFKGSVLISNCDIIIESDYYDIVQFHKTKDYDLTIVGSFRHYVIPYGICKMESGGDLIEIHEKPEYDFLVNTGMYLLKEKVLDLIPANKVFHMTDLLAKLKEKGCRVGVFPIDEKSWVDIGQWEEYQRAIKIMDIR